MKPEPHSDPQIVHYTRADALRDGVLLDISEPASRYAFLEVPTAITLGLWRALAGDAPFQADDERIKELCYATAFAAVDLIPNECADVEDGREMRFTFKLSGRPLSVRLFMTHDQTGETIATIMLPRSSQPKPGASPGAGPAG